MQQPAMDADAFAEMKALMGDSFNDVITLTLKTLPEQLEQLQLAISNKDAENIFNTAHRIKSSTSTIGALGVANNAEAIELIGRGGSSDISSELFDALSASITDVIAILKAELTA